MKTRDEVESKKEQAGRTGWEGPTGRRLAGDLWGPQIYFTQPSLSVDFHWMVVSRGAAGDCGLCKSVLALGGGSSPLGVRVSSKPWVPL